MTVKIFIVLSILLGVFGELPYNITTDTEDAKFDEELLTWLNELCQIADAFKEEIRDFKAVPKDHQVIKRFKKETKNWLNQLQGHIDEFRSEVRNVHQVDTSERVKRSYASIMAALKKDRMTYRPNLLVKPSMECATQVAELVDQSKGCMCGAHKTMVEVPQQFNNEVFPKCIVLEQCMGPCSHPNMKCAAVKTEEHHMPVVSGTKCKSVPMEKHIHCECQCGMTKEDCNDEQVFDAVGCQCKCKHTPNCSYNMKINIKTCKCECMEIEECSTGLEFDMGKCMCV